MSIRFSVISNSATYDLTPSVSNVDEGSQVTVALSTTGVQNGQALPYTIYGTGITSADYVGLSSLDGEFVVQGGAANVQLTISEDHITEGVEQFTLALSNGAAINVDINDTSIQEGYALSHNVSNLNEGQSVIFTLDTVGVPNGTSVPYTISGSGISASDFTSNSLTGNFVVNNNVATVTLTLSNDVALEGSESFVLALNNGLATATAVTVYDTSVPTVTLTPSVNNVDEGNQVTITLNVTNGTVPNGTVLPYTISGTGITAADFTGLASLTGSFTVNGGTASVVLTTSADSATEGSETFSLALDNGMASTGVIINDTSTAAPVDPYAGQVVFNVNAYGGTAVDTAPVSPLHTVTAYGTGNIVTDAPAGSAYPYSMYGQGTQQSPTRYFEVSFNSGDTTMGTGDFTMEAWIKVIAWPTSTSQIFGFFTSTSTYQYLSFSNTGSLSAATSNPGNTVETIPLNTWTHVTLMRKSGYGYLYINGHMTRDTIGLMSTNFGAYSKFYIGRQGTSTSGHSNNVYFHNVRVTKAARYKTSFTAPTEAFSATDPYWNNVVLLAHFDGTNGSTSFTDEKGMTLTPVGTAALSSTQSKFGGTSLYLAGSANRIDVSGHGTGFVFGTGDFTIECWVYRTATATYQGILLTGTYATNQIGVRLIGGKVQVYISGSTVLDGEIDLGLNTWRHIAVTRHNGTMTIFVDGQMDTAIYSAHNITSVSGTPTIGADRTYYLSGYIDELRVTKGVARYTSNFTPEVNY